MNTVIDALYFFLPAGLANMAPVFATLVPGLKNINAPLDFGRSYRGRRIFGSNKTLRGIVSGGLLGSLTALAQFYASKPELLSAQSLGRCLLCGGAMGLAALLADAIKSFFKRQIGVAPGKPWIPFDQTDYILGGLLVSIQFVHLSALQVGSILVIYTGGHLLANFVGHRLGLRKSPI
ncbi:CDP-archaeol synthase [Candidatus Saccharibacteria bacterium]|nr:MAG: CDP-archaeol synthase [Candidatus Saccharibacteria bacterium]